jgi:putative spermidine/putrescine transport system permease protein
LFALLISWSQYLLTLLIGGGQVITLPILLFRRFERNPLHDCNPVVVIYRSPVLVIAATRTAIESTW